MASSSTLPPIPVTCFTGFLGAGKTTTILGLLNQLPKDYKVVLLKNEYGEVQVDSLLASQSQITGVSEILNGCLCCTMVGLVENALIEIRDTYRPDRIIIESSGSAFPATLALQIRQLEPQGFKLDGVVTVIDCVNFRGYEDTSPSAKLQARYTDLLLLSKHSLLSENQHDILMDHLGTLNDTTPRIRIGPDQPITPDVIFGLDTKLFLKTGEEGIDWEGLAGGVGLEGRGHGEEIETRGVRRGGKGKGKGKGGHSHEHEHGHVTDGDCGCKDDEKKSDPDVTGETFDSERGTVKVDPISKELLESELSKLGFEIYRVKGIVRLVSDDQSRRYDTYILNYAFSRHELTRIPSLDEDETIRGVSLNLTMMGERGEVAVWARKFAAGLKAEVV